MRRLTLGLLACTALCGSSCFLFGERKSSEEDTDPDEEQYVCVFAEPTEQDARPLEDIELRFQVEAADLPGLFSESAHMQVTFEGNPEVFVVPVIYDADAHDWSFIAPIHPDWRRGGMSTVQLVADGLRCDAHPLEIEPLETAPDGTLEEVLEIQRAMIETQAAAFGFELEDLRDLSQIPVEILPLGLALEILDGPDNPNSIEAIAAGTAPILDDGSPDDLELVEALLYSVDHAGWLEELDEDFQAADPLPDTLQWAAVQRYETRAQSLDCTDLITVQTSNAASTVSALFQRAAIALDTLRSKHRKKLDTAIGLVGKLPAGDVATILLSAPVILVDGYVLERTAFNLPSSLTNPRAKITHDSFPEDSEEKGQVTEFLVDAYTKEWDANKPWKEIVRQSLVAIAGRAVGKATEGKLAEAEINDKAGKLLDAVSKKLAEDIGPNSCIIPAKKWSDIRLTFPVYASLDARFAVKRTAAESDRYEPRHVGAGLLVLAANPGAFPPAENEITSRLELPVKVREIEIELDPSGIRVEKGQSLDITAIVRNAVDRRVEWEVQTGNATITSKVEGTADTNPVATLVVGDVADDEWILVRATSLSTSGIRNVPAPPERFGQGIYQSWVDLAVYPGSKCVKKGEPLQFTAHVIGHDDEDVRWTATGGTISNDGLYVGSQKGKFEVTATSTVDPDVKDTAKVYVDECTCDWNVHLAGALNRVYSGVDTVAVSYTKSVGALTVAMSEADSGFAGTIFALGSVPGSAEGSYPANFGGEIVAGDMDLSDRFQTEQDAGLIEVVEWDATRIKARFDGTAQLFILDPYGDDPLPFKVDVRAEIDSFIANPEEFPGSLVNECGGDVLYDGTGPFGGDD